MICECGRRYLAFPGNTAQDSSKLVLCFYLQCARHTISGDRYAQPDYRGAAMAMSSVSVVSNSLLLKRWQAGS